MENTPSLLAGLDGFQQNAQWRSHFISARPAAMSATTPFNLSTTWPLLAPLVVSRNKLSVGFI
jgi:hypothetical protein